MKIVETIESVRSMVALARAEGKKVGFVPTMGALHAGHLSLIETAVNECDFVIASIFVNPTQFGPGEDLGKYPRDLAADSDLCEKAGVDAIFAPAVEEMYPEKNISWVNVDGLTDYLCGSSRPEHFRGVTTVCAKLFNIVMPDIAFFGQKDAQQAAVIKRMVKDLNMPMEIAVCPTVRESDGLAMSSRNKYLTAEERKDAAILYKALSECEKAVRDGVTECAELVDIMKKTINRSPLIEVEYISIVDIESLGDVSEVRGRVLVALAVRLGTTRLIDNIIF
jgi:pantoate--beta-alanine ligase